VGGVVYSDMREYYASLSDRAMADAAEAARFAAEEARLGASGLSQALGDSLGNVLKENAVRMTMEERALSSAQRAAARLAEEAATRFAELRGSGEFTHASDTELKTLLGGALAEVLIASQTGGIKLAAPQPETTEPTASEAEDTRPPGLADEAELEDSKGMFLRPVSDLLMEAAMDSGIKAAGAAALSAIEALSLTNPATAAVGAAMLSYPNVAKWYNRGMDIARIGRAVVLAMPKAGIKTLPKVSAFRLPEVPTLQEAYRALPFYKGIMAERTINVNAQVIKHAFEYTKGLATGDPKVTIPRTIRNLALDLVGPPVPGVVQSVYDRLAGPEVVRMYNGIISVYNAAHGTALPEAETWAELQAYDSGSATGGALNAPQLSLVAPPPEYAPVPFQPFDAVKLPMGQPEPLQEVPFNPGPSAPLFPAVMNAPGFMYHT
jgi:hypothetical protein